MRAIRFSTRFSFTISKHTLTLMKGALKMQMFDKIEGKRLLNELIHILNEKNPIPALSMMAGFGIPQALHPALNLTSRTFELMESISGYSPGGSISLQKIVLKYGWYISWDLRKAWVTKNLSKL